MQGMLSWIALVCSLVSLRRIATLRQSGRNPTEPAVPHALQPVGEHPRTRRFRRRNWIAIWTAIFTGLTVLCTFGILYYTRVYTHAMLDYTRATNHLLAEQTNANQSNQCTFYTLQIAQLAISKIDNITFDPIEKIYDIQYEIGNFRNSSARKVSINTKTFIDDAFQEPEQTHFVPMIFPYREYTCHHKLNSQQYADVRDGKKVEVLVRLDYTDYENIQHYTIEKMRISYSRLYGRVEFPWDTLDVDSYTHKSCIPKTESEMTVTH
jgi:hypothetical protein